MDAKDLIKNKSMCVLPWTGFELEPTGEVKNCIMSKQFIGDINKSHIKDIINGKANIDIKRDMLKDSKPHNCSGCYLQEKHRSSLDSISSRLYYLKEVGANLDLSTLDDPKNFDLKHVDLRWTNSCNQACVYCGPDYSSKWMQELGWKVKSKKEARQEVKDFVFENIEGLQNVYLAGGEPMLMKENYEFLKLLKDKNPDCHVRVNSNLSSTDTGVFDLLCSLKNVHWTISVETIEQEYEYVRHLGSWTNFCSNLERIQKLPHKISFNMLHFIFNYHSLFDCVDYFKAQGFHDNSFVIGPLYTPEHMNLLNLPDTMIQSTVDKIKDRLDAKPLGFLKNSYENLISYYTSTPWKKDIKEFYKQTHKRDTRRGVDSRQIFNTLYKEIDDCTLE